MLATALAAGWIATAWPPDARGDAIAASPGLRSTAIGVYRPQTAEFFGRDARPGFSDDPYAGFHVTYGTPGDVPVVGDWDGNGSQTQGVFRDGVWSLTNALDDGGGWPLANTLGNPYGAYAVSYGARGDHPLVGDWDGDGLPTIGVQRGSRFLLSNSNLSPATAESFAYGRAGDVAVVGDWDGDGVDTIGVYRSGTWYLRNSNTGGAADLVVSYGTPAGVPIVGDWDSDGRVGLGAFDRGGWQLSNSITSPATDVQVAYGKPADRPLVGNWGSTSQRFGRTPAALSSFFPIAVDFQPPSRFATWKQRGVNTVIRVPAGIGTESWTRAADAIGLKMIRAPGPNPALDEADPNLLAFAGPDEPELNGCDPDCVRAQYLRLRATAPSKPYLLNLAGTTALFRSPPSDPRSCNGPGDGQGATDCMTGYAGATDWVSSDIYPVNAGLPLGSLGSVLDRLRRWSDRRPQFAYIEASDYDGDGRRPTPQEFRGEIWDAIIHGARGISYFVVDAQRPRERPDAVPPDIVTEMRAQDARITQLAPVLQTTINPAAVGVKAKPPIEYTWRRFGSTTYLIALNQSPAPVAGATIKLLGVKVPPAITVVGESRTLPAAGTAFTDSFGGYDVHVYEF